MCVWAVWGGGWGGGGGGGVRWIEGSAMESPSGDYRNNMTELINNVMTRTADGKCYLDKSVPFYSEMRSRKEKSWFQNSHEG